jgi:hypothetical protein
MTPALYDMVYTYTNKSSPSPILSHCSHGFAYHGATEKEAEQDNYQQGDSQDPKRLW